MYPSCFARLIQIKKVKSGGSEHWTLKRACSKVRISLNRCGNIVSAVMLHISLRDCTGSDWRECLIIVASFHLTRSLGSLKQIPEPCRWKCPTCVCRTLEANAFWIVYTHFLWRGSTVVKVMCYISEGRWFDPSWCQGIFHWHKILPIALWPWGRLSL